VHVPGDEQLCGFVHFCSFDLNQRGRAFESEADARRATAVKGKPGQFTCLIPVRCVDLRDPLDCQLSGLRARRYAESEREEGGL
jgi:hypothetical protein